MLTLVLQSHRQPLPQPWLQHCLESVETWARSRGFAYRFLGDELFDPLLDPRGGAPVMRERIATQPVVASDLARLLALEAALISEFERAIWIDADVLMLPQATDLALPSGHGVGRQLWVSAEHRKRSARTALKTTRQVHNAFMVFERGDPVLPFYRRAAQQILREHRSGPVAPQLIGPKLLTALHRLARFNVIEAAGMLPPLVAADLLAGRGPALEHYQRNLTCGPLALNLCGSLTAELSSLGVAPLSLIERLLDPSIERLLDPSIERLLDPATARLMSPRSDAPAASRAPSCAPDPAHPPAGTSGRS
ncbi:MAG: hypothetical protein AAGI15_13485 [Pseudomonadota bacterium]